MLILSICLITLSLILGFKSIIIVQPEEAIIIERFGKYHKTLYSGFNLIVPCLDIPISKVDLKENIYNFQKQNATTKDNIIININTILYIQIIDPKSSVYKVLNLNDAIEKITHVNLKNLVSGLDLDEILDSKDKLNQELQVMLEKTTNKLGVKINRIELKEIVYKEREIC